ncbi:MAG TPA: hypothetical protein VG818_14330, partial [Gemmatimonadaceae bacterium]|nr:hypothetical protein [Gemmatimonadaceae bacterium]
MGALTLAAAPAAAQQGSATDARLRAQRDTLEQIRSERAALERRMQELRSSAHDLSEEVANLNSRADATARIVRTLDHQLETITVDVAEATRDLVRTQDELVAQRAVLRRRLV